MRLSAIITAIVTYLATAHVVRTPEPQGFEGLQEIIQQISTIPGISAIKGMLQCIHKDATWKVDYSDKNNGKIMFSSVTKPCCDRASAGWGKYGDKWSKFAKASFNDPCDGGQLSGMKEENVDRLRAVLGSGH